MTEVFACLGLGALVAGSIWDDSLAVVTGFFFLFAATICSLIGV